MMPVHVVRSGLAQDASNFIGSSPTAPGLAANFGRGTDILLRDHSHFIPHGIAWPGGKTDRRHVGPALIKKVSPKTVTIDDQLTYLKKGLADLIREEDLRERLIQAGKTGRPLRVKAGFDPRRPTCTSATRCCCAR